MQPNQTLVAAFTKTSYWLIPQETTARATFQANLHSHTGFHLVASVFLTSKGECHRLRDPAWMGHTNPKCQRDSMRRGVQMAAYLLWCTISNGTHLERKTTNVNVLSKHSVHFTYPAESHYGSVLSNAIFMSVWK